MSADPIITATEARAQLREWLNALEACSSGANYSIAGRSLTRQDVADVILPTITRWHRMVLALEAQANGRSRPLGATACFGAPGAGGGAGGIRPLSSWVDSDN